MICSNFFAFASSASRSSVNAGKREWLSSITAATCMAVGNLQRKSAEGKYTIRDTDVSFELWLMLTWSFGCTGFFDPSSPPMISIARFEMTSFVFMLLCVPLPVWNTTSGKWSMSLPEMTYEAIHPGCQFLRTPSLRVTIGDGNVHRLQPG